jgi:uncharacterized protein
LIETHKTSLIVTESGPLIALSVTNLLSATAETFGTLNVPEAVITECIMDKNAPGMEAITLSIKKGQLQIVNEIETQHLDQAYLLGLGSGEVSVLAYAKLKNWIALIDERRARRIAKQLEIPVIGSGAILIELKKQKQIASVKPALVAWQAHGYFLSDGVISDILKAANESEINPR